MVLNAICKHDPDLWTAVLPLICYYVVEWHLSICVLLLVWWAIDCCYTKLLHSKCPTLFTYVYYVLLQSFLGL
jgi:hypothetical protein